MALLARCPAAGCAALLGLLATGCSQGVNWRLEPFERVQADSKSRSKLTFVYFRNWHSVKCTEFEEKVLKAPAVLNATTSLNCVPLEYDWDRPLAEKFGITETPAFVVLDPNGYPLARGSGTISEAALLKALAEARQTTSAPQPAKP